MWLSATEIAIATEAPAELADKATDTAITLASMTDRSNASTSTAPSRLMPLGRVSLMRASTWVPTRLTALAPAPLIETAVPPLADAAAEPERTSALIAWSSRARTLKPAATLPCC